MHDRAIHLVEYLVEDAFPRQQRADRHVAAGKRLRQEHHVGLDIPVLDREVLTGAADPVWISSAMNSVPYFRHSAAAPGKNWSDGMLTPLPWIGSTMKAATWRDDSACSSAVRC